MKDIDPARITKWLTDEPRQIREWLEQHGVKTYSYMVVRPVPEKMSAPKRSTKARISGAVAYSAAKRGKSSYV